ncbi:hypothetical protein BGX30_004019 [Mortierella sp. GBA39]|nr:hypothetical protein BGX30_004019 [Mortierella sp. GBA39]
MSSTLAKMYPSNARLAQELQSLLDNEYGHYRSAVNTDEPIRSRQQIIASINNLLQQLLPTAPMRAIASEADINQFISLEVEALDQDLQQLLIERIAPQAVTTMATTSRPINEQRLWHFLDLIRCALMTPARILETNASDTSSSSCIFLTDFPWSSWERMLMLKEVS